jgi:hypothetical protein
MSIRGSIGQGRGGCCARLSHPGLIALAILACCFSILYALVTGGRPSFLAALGISRAAPR